MCAELLLLLLLFTFFFRFVLFSWFLPISTNFVGRIEANEYNKWKMNEKNPVPSFSICLRLSGCDVLLLLLLVSFFLPSYLPQLSESKKNAKKQQHTTGTLKRVRSHTQERTHTTNSVETINIITEVEIGLYGCD